jgi:hypothetical protein
MKTLKLLLGAVAVAVACYCNFVPLRADWTILGVAVSSLLLAAGVAGICTRAQRGGTCVAGVLYLAAFVIGLIWHGSATWMLSAAIYSFLCAAASFAHAAWMDGKSK